VTFNSPTPPQLINEEGTTDRAASLDSVLLMRDPFTLLNLRNFSTDQRTRIMLFALNVDLLPNEDASAVLAQIRDAQMNVYVPTVEFVGKPAGVAPFTQIVLRLPDNLPVSQTLMVNITFHGQMSNVVRIRIQ
jgi:hypothetical protein